MTIKFLWQIKDAYRAKRFMSELPIVTIAKWMETVDKEIDIMHDKVHILHRIMFFLFGIHLTNGMLHIS